MANKKKDLEIKQALAFRMYMSGDTQKMIAAAIEVTPATVTKWKKEFDWEFQKQEQNSSTTSLANSLMTAAKRMSELIIQEIGRGTANLDTVTKCSDNLVKIMASAERIAKTVTKAMIIDVLISLERWLMLRAENDQELTPEIISLINKYNKEYIKFISSQEG